MAGEVNECSYTCLYQVWAGWDAGNGEVLRDTEPAGYGYYKCHIENSRDPANAKASFRAPKPGWARLKWGVYVRDGWDRYSCTFN